jgi:hypothetical protein
MTNTFTRTLSAITGVGVILFIAVVLFLQRSQPQYNPFFQFISELVFGRFGDLLWLAFVGLSTAASATAVNLLACKSSVFLPLLLAIAGACFFAAGIITLATSIQIHVSLVAAGFVSCALGMYLLPRCVAAFSGIGAYLVSWGSGLAMCVATGLGNDTIPPGVAQRISAVALLFWLSFVAWSLVRVMRAQS